jgi:hypothetical protein
MAKKYINSQTKVNLVVEFVTKIEQEYDENSLLCHINKKNPKVQVFDKHREMIHINIVDQEEVLKDLSV